MAILLTDDTAMWFWRWRASSGSQLSQFAPARLKAVPEGSPPPSDIVAACDYFRAPDEPVCALVARASDVRRTCDVSYRVFGGVLPAGSFVRLNEGVYVASPEYLALRMAARLTRIELLRLLYELCGCYVLNENDARGFSGCQPITNLSRVSSFAKSASGMRGVREMRLLVGRASERSASPRETDVDMMLTLPLRMGGYALPKPALNERIVLTESQRKLIDREAITPDMLWRGARLALEYESDEWHSGNERFVRDSRRRNDLKALGYDVVTVTNAELKSLREMDRIASGIARRLGVRMRVSLDDHDARKLALRTSLADIQRRGRSAKAGVRLI